ncbi:MAG: glycosyltransferase family 4 protein [Candidatus Stahlbacteria bacterium]|nr:glycosyltransferase family 4 protein [Candidatus Stahlbacteria bacterium]
MKAKSQTITNMNVCMVVHAYYPHDESRVQREAIALHQKGHKIDVICLRKGKEAIYGQQEDGINFYRLPVTRREKPSIVGYIFEYSAFFILASIKLNLLFLRKRYKIIQFHNPPDILVFAGLIPKLLGAKIILDLHDLMPELYAAKFNLKIEQRCTSWLIRVLIFVEQIACKFADYVLTVTEVWRIRLLKRGVQKEKCSVVMNLPDERIFKHIKYNTEEKEHFNLIYHGTLVKRYGVDIAIKAVSIINIPNIKLNIIGDGEELEELIKLAHSLSLQDKVYFSKKFIPVNVIPDIIAKMDVGLVPNRVNIFTNDILNAKLLEYVASGIPTIVSRTAGIEYYLDESKVVFFEPGNAEILAQKILWLYNNPAERIKLATNAKKFLTQYNWRNEKEKYCAIISSLS